MYGRTEEEGLVVRRIEPCVWLADRLGRAPARPARRSGSGEDRLSVRRTERRRRRRHLSGVISHSRGSPVRCQPKAATPSSSSNGRPESKVSLRSRLGSAQLRRARPSQARPRSARLTRHWLFPQRGSLATQTLLDEQPAPSGAALAELSTAGLGLQDELTSRASSLPTYELRRAEQAGPPSTSQLGVIRRASRLTLRCAQLVKSLLERLSALKASSSAKPKFAFKRALKPAAAAPGTQPTSTSPAAAALSAATHPSPAVVRGPPAVPPTALTLASVAPGYLTTHDLTSTSTPTTTSTTASSRTAQSLLISSFHDSFVDLLPSDDAPSTASSTATFSALYLYDLSDCVVLLPPIGGSVMLHNCKRCTIVLGVHQVSIDSPARIGHA